MVDAPPGTALRLSCFYGAYFGVMGVMLPFWPAWLEARGLGEEAIGALVAAGMGVRVVANPWFAQAADRRGERRRPMLALAWSAAAAFACFALARGLVALAAVTLLFAVLWGPVLALGESIAVHHCVRSRGPDYGRVRLWGSLGFIGAAAASGPLLAATSIDSAWVAVLLLLAVVASCCHGMPDVPPAPGAEAPRPRGRSPARRLLRRPAFVVFLATVSAVQASHAMYYAFGTLHWLREGLGETTIGLLWAEGVIAEVALFALGPGLTRRVAPASLLALGAIAAAVRWSVTAGTTDVIPLALVQPLHAFTFGATHLGAVRLIGQCVRPDVAATAQGLYGGVANGGALGLAVLAAGPAFELWQGRAFLAMAALGLVGTAGALVLLGRARRARLRIG